MASARVPWRKKASIRPAGVKAIRMRPRGAPRGAGDLYLERSNLRYFPMF